MNTERHILFVASWYPNRNHPVLGNFIQRHAQCAALSNRVSVVAAFSTEDECSCIPIQNGNLTEYLSYYHKIKVGDNVLGKVRKVKAYRKAIREAIELAISKNGTPNVMHIHVAWPAALAVVPITLEMKIPIVLTEHWSGYLPEDGNYRGYFLKRYTKKLFAAAKIITVVSERMKTALLGHGLVGKFQHLSNAVDTTLFNFSPQKNLTANTVCQFLHVSMLVDREKNITGLLQGFSEASKQAPMRLTIVGDGPERQSHEATTKELGISSLVDFVGLKNPNEIADLMNRCDALVMFSHFEGMPVTIIEAQCCGLPVIATNTGAIPEMLSVDHDILVTPGKVDELTKALVRITEHFKTSDSSKSVRSDIAKKAQSRYSLQAVGEQLDAIYKEVIRK